MKENQKRKDPRVADLESFANKYPTVIKLPSGKKLVKPDAEVLNAAKRLEKFLSNKAQGGHPWNW